MTFGAEIVARYGLSVNRINRVESKLFRWPSPGFVRLWIELDLRFFTHVLPLMC
jgi:hypothetical protein